MTVDALIEEIIKREGGFSNHKDDTGSATKFGITKATLTAWRGHHVTVADVKNLEVTEAREIYASVYVVNPGFDALPDPLRAHVVDFGVNAGPHQATRMLQRALGSLTVDGVLGPKTRAAIAAADVRGLTRTFWQERVRFYIHLVGVKPSQLVFADGWLNRVFGMWPE